MRGTEYAILEIVWWMLAAAFIGFLIGWVVRRFLLQRGLEREYQAKLGSAHEQAAHLREELNEWKLSVSALDKRLTKTGADLAGVRDDAAEKTAGLEARARELAEARSIMEKQQSALVELQSEMTTRQSELESATEGISQLESTIKSLRQDLETAQQKTDDTESRFGGIIKDKDAEISRLVEEAAAIPSLEAELEQQSLGIGDLERHLEESRERLGRLEEELATVTEDLARGDAGLSERDDRISELTAQLAAIPQERAETLAELEERDERITELEAQLYSAVQDQIESTAELHERDERIAQLESRLGLSGWQEPRYPDRDTAIVRMAEIAQRTRGSGPIVDDDLKLIHGVGPQLERLLKSLGITSFRQVANLQTDDIAYVSAALSAFPGRIERDNWMASAAEQHRKMYGEPP